MPSPESLRIIPLALFGLFFLIGLANRPVFFPMSFMTLVLTKLANYYSFISALKLELIVGVLGLAFVLAKGGPTLNQVLSPKKNLVQAYFLFLLGCILVSFVVAWDHAYSWDIKLYNFLKVIILYLMVSISIKTEKDLTMFIWFFVLFYVYLAYEPVHGFLTGSGADQQMYGDVYTAKYGLLSGHVALANNMNQMLPFAYFLFLGAKSKVGKSLALFALVIFMVCLVGSKSRGGVAGFLMLGALIVLFSENKLRNGAFVLLIGIAMFFTSSDLGNTLSRIDSQASSGRLIGLTHGFFMIIQGNILGVGPGCYLIARSHYFGWYMESHNIYGQVMGDLGIPGTIAAFLFVRQIFKYLFKSRSFLKKAGKTDIPLYYIATAIIVSLSSRLFVSLGSHGLYFFYYYVVAALSFPVYRISREKARFSLKELDQRSTPKRLM